VAAQPELLRRFLLSTRHECLAALPSAAAKVREALLEHALAHGKWVRIAGGERQPDALYAEWTVRAMQLAVRVCERAVFAALAALADFGMLRRERLLDARGRVRGLAYWLFPPPEKLTEAGKRRIRDAVRKKRARAAEEVGWATALGIDLDDDAADATAPEAKGEGR
jgi:predicted DNA-binding transcriptional regulator